MVELSENLGTVEDFDLDWDDKHVVPPTIYPDLAFLFNQLEAVALREVQPDAGEEILDVGCGRATDATALAKKSGRCIGLEPSGNMIRYARQCISQNGTNVGLIRGLGEYLPLKASSLDKIVCKGALDHFPRPQVAIEEMARVLKPDGRAVIGVANLESLSCRLGRSTFVRIRKILRRQESIYEKMWETPFDHTYRFDYKSIRELVEPHMEIERCVGVSLLFGLPWWGMILNRLPRRVAGGVLRLLDSVARRIPSLSDVVVVRCKPRKITGST